MSPVLRRFDILESDPYLASLAAETFEIEDNDVMETAIQMTNQDLEDLAAAARALQHGHHVASHQHRDR